MTSSGFISQTTLAKLSVSVVVDFSVVVTANGVDIIEQGQGNSGDHVRLLDRFLGSLLFFVTQAAGIGLGPAQCLK